MSKYRNIGKNMMTLGRLSSLRETKKVIEPIIVLHHLYQKSSVPIPHQCSAFNWSFSWFVERYILSAIKLLVCWSNSIRTVLSTSLSALCGHGVTHKGHKREGVTAKEADARTEDQSFTSKTRVRCGDNWSSAPRAAELSHRNRISAISRDLQSEREP